MNDYISDVMLPSMLQLADMGSEIMWCDCCGPNATMKFASTFYNNALREGRQVTMNNRCGLPGDFDTPEYSHYGAVQPRKWEFNLGVDPFSFGYNKETPPSKYMNASTLITNLVDIVSKNGNFLLDVGPQLNGTIIDVEQRALHEAGRWLKSHGEAI